MLLITLRFYATGSFQQVIGDLFGVSKSTISKVITIVSHYIALLRETFINMPNTQEAICTTQKGFFNIARFPRVIAALDCTHVKILSPGEYKKIIILYMKYTFTTQIFTGGDDAEIFRNRKGFFSFNVQTMCDSDLIIRDIVARWPGSTHDATILRNSRICHRLESAEFGNGIIIADKGYENNERLITPLTSVNSEAESLFNESLIRTRNTVERSYGVWKRRFPILSLGIRMACKKVQSIIVATAVLHNICCQNADKEAPSLPPEVERAIEQVLSVPHNLNLQVTNDKNFTRRNLINTYFSSLV